MNVKNILVVAISVLVAGSVGYLLGSRQASERGAQKEAALQSQLEQKIAAIARENADNLAALKAEIASREAKPAAVSESKPVVVTPAPEPEPALPDLPPPYKKVKVVVVGINYEGAPDVKPLRYAESDARQLADLLGQDYRFEVVSLIGAAATKDAIQNMITSTTAGLALDEDFLFYFAGHGETLANDGRGAALRTGLLIPSDFRRKGPNEARVPARESAIDIAWVLTQLVASPGRHRFAVFDSCFSGLPATNLAGGSALADRRNLLQHRSVRLISAGREDEKALEFESRKSGLFSDEFRKAIAGSTGWRSLENLFAQIEYSIAGSPELTQELQGSAPIPQLRTYQGAEGDFVFIRPAHYTAWGLSHQSGMGVARIATKIEIPPPAPISIRALEDLEIGQRDFTFEQVASYMGKVYPPETAQKPQLADGLLQKIMGTETRRPVVPPDPSDLRHARVRAARGDPEAMAFVSLAEGQSPDKAARKVAFEYAWSALEASGLSPATEQDAAAPPPNAGELAMGVAYTEGYVGPKQPKVGGLLLQKSGYQKAVPWITAALFAVGLENLGKGKKDEAMLAFGAAGVSFLFAELSEFKFHKELTDARMDLAAKKPKFRDVAKDLEKTKEKVMKHEFFGDESKSALVDTLLQTKARCDQQDAAGAIALLDPLIAKYAPVTK